MRQRSTGLLDNLLNDPLKLTFVLLVVFHIKHFLADFPLQFNFMLKYKVSETWNFVIPLSMHCLIHSSFTLLICLVIDPSYWWLAVVDFGVHFAMDRLKAGPRYLGRFNDPAKSSFWISLGFDQMIHHLTDILVIYILVT